MLAATALAPAAEFESSNDLMNRICQTVNWTYRCLTIGGYVVDCPHRKRLGRGGDAGTSLETGMFNFGTGALYKWLAFVESKTVNNVLGFYKSYGMNMLQWDFLGDWVTPRRAGQPDIARDPPSAQFIDNLHYLYTVQLTAKIAAKRVYVGGERPPRGSGRGGTRCRRGEREGAVRGGFETVRLRAGLQGCSSPQKPRKVSRSVELCRRGAVDADGVGSGGNSAALGQGEGSLGLGGGECAGRFFRLSGTRL